MFNIFYIFLFLTLIKFGESDFVKCIAECVELSDCYEAKMFLEENGTIPQICGFSGTDPKVCCAEQDEKTLFDIHYGGLRKVDKKCKELRPPVIPRRKNSSSTSFSAWSPYGGYAVDDFYQFRYMAAVGYGNINSPIYRCGGFLLEKKIVITAAHCAEINGEPPSVVRIGSYPLSSNRTEPIKIVKIISHPKYQPQSYLHDIAIIILAEDSKEDPACLFTQRVSLRHDNQTIALGFGTTSFGGPFSDQLIKVYMSIKENSVCEKEFEDQPIVKSQLCALGETRIFENMTSAVQDTCQGDSGGPLVLGRDDNYVVGIVSYGRGCGTEAPGIYTHVASYFDWIKLIMRQEGLTNSVQGACKKVEPPYLTISSCNKAGKTGISCNSIANVGFDFFNYMDSMVALGYGDIKNVDYRCDGFLVEKNVVITAAQCAEVNGKPPILVRIGNIKFYSEQIETIRIVKVISHPKYQPETYLNDIAIVFLAQNSAKEPSCLTSSKLDLTTISNIYAVSLGTTTFDGPLTADLFEIKMNIFNKSVCEKQNNNKPLHDSQLCAVAERVEYVGDDTYQGNSGGPLHLHYLDYLGHVIGIISYGQGLGVYTNITAYLDWIESVVWPDGTQKEKIYIT